MGAWIKKYKISIIVIFICLLAIGGVITGAILGKNNAPYNTAPPTASVPEQSENNNIAPDNETPTEKVYTLMDLGSKGCVPCDNLQPVLADLRERYEGKINVLFYDIARTKEGRDLANQYKIQYMPTLIFLDENGKEVKRIVGFQSETQLETLFRQLGWIE